MPSGTVEGSIHYRFEGSPSVDEAIHTEAIDGEFAFAERDQFTNDLADGRRMLEAVAGARRYDKDSLVVRVKIDHEVRIRRCRVKTSGGAVAYASVVSPN
jgi:hypothetical protein